MISVENLGLGELVAPTKMTLGIKASGMACAASAIAKRKQGYFTWGA